MLICILGEPPNAREDTETGPRRGTQEGEIQVDLGFSPKQIKGLEVSNTKPKLIRDRPIFFCVLLDYLNCSH